MKQFNRLFSVAALVLLAGSTLAGGFNFRVVARGLLRPTGIAARGEGDDKTIFFTQIPTPGISGAHGGTNSINALNLENGRIRMIHSGEPEPVSIAYSRGELYWTCRTAGVILKRDRDGEIGPILTDLQKPTGLAVDLYGQVYFTQLPTPGVNGAHGGTNTVDVFVNNSVFNLTRGEPEPTSIAVSSDGTVYWTCHTAGVVLQRTRLGVVSLVAGGLQSPTGIALNDRCDKLYWTEVPTPGMSGSNGGHNMVKELDLNTNTISIVHSGDPEPRNITVARDGDIYWTCSSAGVIVEGKPQ